MRLLQSLLSLSSRSIPSFISTPLPAVPSVEEVSASTTDVPSQEYQDDISRQRRQHHQHQPSHHIVGLKYYVFRFRHYLLQFRLVAFSSQAPLRRFLRSRIGLMCMVALLSFVAFILPLPGKQDGGREDTGGRFFASDLDTSSTPASTRRMPFFSNGDRASSATSSSRSTASAMTSSEASASSYTTSSTLIMSTLSSSLKLLVVAPLIKLQQTQQRTPSPHALESWTPLVARSTPLCCIPTLDIIAHHRSSALYSEGCTPSARSQTASASISLHAKILRAVVDMARGDNPLCSSWNRCTGLASALSTPLILALWAL